MKNAKPISMLLIADTETGKTQILEVFMNLKPVIWANDLSAHVIVDEGCVCVCRRPGRHLDRTPKLRALEDRKIGFRNIAKRTWLDVGIGITPEITSITE